MTIKEPAKTNSMHELARIMLDAPGSIVSVEEKGSGETTLTIRCNATAEMEWITDKQLQQLTKAST